MLNPEKAKIIWNCRRGMLELDLLLQNFVNAKLEALDTNELKDMQQLLKNSDPELLSWLMDYETPPNELINIVNLIRASNKT